MKPRTQQIIGGFLVICVAMIPFGTICMLAATEGSPLTTYAATFCLIVGFALMVTGVFAIAGIPQVN